MSKKYTPFIRLWLALALGSTIFVSCGAEETAVPTATITPLPAAISLTTPSPSATAVPPTSTNTATAVPPTSTATPPSTATQTPSPTPTFTPSPPPTATPDEVVYGRLDEILLTGRPVTFWHNYDGFAATILNEIATDFNQSNPYGITVQPIAWERFSDLQDAVQIGLAEGEELPALAAAYPDHTLGYAAKDGVVDMRPYLHHSLYGLSESDTADFFPYAQIQTETPLFGLPLHRTLELLYINNGWLASLNLPFAGAPQTPEEFAQAACAAADPAQGKIGYEIEPTSGNFLAWIHTYGGDVYDEAGQNFTFNTPEVMAAMTMLQQLVQDGCAAPASGFSYQDHFASQHTLFGPGTTRGLYFYGRAINQYNAEPFSWSVAPLPYTGKLPALLLSGPNVNLLRTDPETQLAAWLFLAHFYSPEVQARWAQVNSYLPARAAAASFLNETFAADPAYAAAFALLPYGADPPAPTGRYEVWQAVVDAYGRILQNEEVTAVLQTLDETLNQLPKGATP
jgi:ABC-type glycerol-3-phosphate transport system substrate-binding protein